MTAEQRLKQEAAAGATEGWLHTQSLTPQQRRASAMRNYRDLLQNPPTINQDHYDTDRQPKNNR